MDRAKYGNGSNRNIRIEEGLVTCNNMHMLDTNSLVYAVVEFVISRRHIHFYNMHVRFLLDYPWMERRYHVCTYDTILNYKL